MGETGVDLVVELAVDSEGLTDGEGDDRLMRMDGFGSDVVVDALFNNM